MKYAVATFVLGVLISFGARSQTPQISVGPEVQINQTDTADVYNEYDAALDPKNPNRMIACAQPHDPQLNNRKITVHMSDDSGKTWRQTLEIKGTRRGALVADPACVFAADGSALAVALYVPDEPRSEPQGWDGFPTGNGMWIYRSTDNGKTWDRKVYGFVDNTNLLVDRTGGRFDGRVYLNGNHEGDRMWLAYSTDNGQTFQRSQPTPTTAHWQRAVRGTILADGTVVLPYILKVGREAAPPGNGSAGQQSAPPRANTYGIARSTDGGVTISLPDTVATNRPYCSERIPTIFPSIAVDTAATSPFRGRIYYLWGEIESRNGAAPRCVPVVASSDDNGKTWSSPSYVGDAPFRARSEKGPDARLAILAVNSRGVVGVTWFDRREDPKNESARLRFSASLDGGETWLPSVAVSSKMHVVLGARGYLVQASARGGGRGRGGEGNGPSASDEVVTSISSLNYQTGALLGGDYTPLISSPDGVFHAFWVDNRGDGEKPVFFFTAPVTVAGTVQRPPELTGLVNVTRDFEFQYQSTNYKRNGATYDIDLGLVLKNVSHDTITGPLKFRILDVRSQMGPMIVRDTRAAAQGAVLDLSSMLPPGGLAPGASTELHEIKLRAGPVPSTPEETTEGIGNFSGKLFGKPRTSGAAPRRSDILISGELGQAL